MYRKYAISFGNEAYLKIKGEIESKTYQSLSDERKKKRLEKRLRNVRSKKLAEVKRRYNQNGLNIKYIGPLN